MLTVPMLYVIAMNQTMKLWTLFFLTGNWFQFFFSPWRVLPAVILQSSSEELPDVAVTCLSCFMEVWASCLIWQNSHTPCCLIALWGQHPRCERACIPSCPSSLSSGPFPHLSGLRDPLVVLVALCLRHTAKDQQELTDHLSSVDNTGNIKF